jgi:hypothetical protein
METFILIVLGFVLGFKVSEAYHVFSFKKILEDLNVSEKDLRRLHSKMAKDLDEDAESPADTKTIIEIKVEQHQGLLFAYEAEHDTFIAQGQDGDELLSRILDKYPVNVRVVCDRSNGGELIEEAVQKLVSQKQ